MTLVVKTQIREFIKEMNVSNDFLIGVEKELEEIIKKAIERAKANNRRTLYARDL
jgi:histone H3/H4